MTDLTPVDRAPAARDTELSDTDWCPNATTCPDLGTTADYAATAVRNTLHTR